MKRRVGMILGIGMVVLVFLLAYSQTGGGLMQYSVHDLKTKVENKDDIVILDVRTPQEYNGELGHLERSILIPVQQLERRVNELDQYRDREIVVICRTDNRSRAAASILREYGFEHVAFVRGGMVGWNTQFGNPQN
jgi:rhodanese-related sulfurtransferase